MPLITLAPMDGYTDAAFRRLVRSIEPRTLCYTEFLSSDYIFFRPREAAAYLDVRPEEGSTIVQLFGKNPEHFAVAARLAQDLGAAGIDVNMGCPAKKVVNSQHGSYLMKNADLGCRIMEAVKKAVTIPVSVKTRLGWDNADNLIPFVQRLVGTGIDRIAIHGRTYSQHFTGTAHWDPIYELKRAIPIPVIGNGDVTSGEKAKEKLGNLDGVMVGRATMGNPWIMKEVAEALYPASLSPQADKGGQGGFLSASAPWQEKLRVMQLHASLLVETKGEKRGMLESRKHMASYVRGIPGAPEFRNRLVRLETLKELETIIAEIRIVALQSSDEDRT